MADVPSTTHRPDGYYWVIRNGREPEIVEVAGSQVLQMGWEDPLDVKAPGIKWLARINPPEQSGG